MLLTLWAVHCQTIRGYLVLTHLDNRLLSSILATASAASVEVLRAFTFLLAKFRRKHLCVSIPNQVEIQFLGLSTCLFWHTILFWSHQSLYI